MFTIEEDWEVDACANVPDGYQLNGILNEKEDVISTSDCVHTFVAGESKVFLYEVEDIGSPEPEVMLNLTTAHNGKVTRLNKKIGGVRKWKEKNLEKHNHKKIKNLAPKWQKSHHLQCKA